MPYLPQPQPQDTFTLALAIEQPVGQPTHLTPAFLDLYT